MKYGLYARDDFFLHPPVVCYLIDKGQRFDAADMGNIILIFNIKRNEAD